MSKNTESANADASRRDFLKTSSVAAMGVGALGSLALPQHLYAADNDDTIKVGLVGCGGRGSRAAVQALSTKGKVKLVAMGDAFADQLENSLKRITRATQKDDDAIVAVDKEHQFVGFDAVDKVLASDIDLIILATPPGFRPFHFEAAVNSGKHVFMEKPVATDAAGVKKVIEAAAAAKAKNLRVGVGLQRHHQNTYRDVVKRIHDGAIGDIVATRVFWNSGGVWEPRRKRDQVKTELEYQLRNWYYYTWICGDHIVEQHIHNLDVSNWLVGKEGAPAYPVSAHGVGGREVRQDKRYGEIFDHHTVEYTYDNEVGTKMFSQCRHQPNCWNSVSEHALGTKGSATLAQTPTITPYDKSIKKYRYRGETNDAYQTEHDDLFEAVRKSIPYNEAVNGAMSTMTAILGRLATYSGKPVKMDEALESEASIFPFPVPNIIEWDAKMENAPDKNGNYQVAVPGIYKPY